MRKCYKPCSKCERYNTNPSKIPWAELCFYIFSTLHIVIAAFYIEKASTDIALLASLTALGKNFNLTSQNSIHSTALLAHLIAVGIIISVIVGVVGAANGYERLLYAHCGMMAICLAVELFACLRLGLRADYCQKQFENLRSVLKYYVTNYHTEQALQYKIKYIDSQTKEVMSTPVYRRWYNYSTVIDSIQRSMGCCGYDNYKDYLDPAKKGDRLHFQNGGPVNYTLAKVPSSCCQRIYANNIFCASNLTSDPAKLKKQIYIEGCAIKLLHFCDELIVAAGPGAFYLWLLHLTILISSLPTIVIQVLIFKTMQSRDLLYYHYHKENLLRHRYVARLATGLHNPPDRILLHEFYAFVNKIRDSGDTNVSLEPPSVSSRQKITQQQTHPITPRPPAQKPGTTKKKLAGPVRRSAKVDALSNSNPGPLAKRKRVNS